MSRSSSSSNNSVKKLDEKNVKILRELASLPSNRQCFECHQRGPTYVDTTIGAFVCTSCSGRLRGLNPPHRLKSMSMASFTAEEIEFVRLRGNEYCRKVWMGKFDKSRASIDETSFKDETQMKDFLSLKYEKKRWFVNPNEVQFSTNNETTTRIVEEQPKNAHLATKPTTSVSSTTLIDPFATPLEKATAKQQPTQQQANFANFDAFMSNGYSASKQQPVDILSSLSSPIPKSQTLPAVAHHRHQQQQPVQDKYSALKELDELFSNSNAPVTVPLPAATASSVVPPSNNVNPFFGSANFSPPRAPFWPNNGQPSTVVGPPATTNPFLTMAAATNQAAPLVSQQHHQFTNFQNFGEAKSSSTNKAWNPFMN